MLLSLAGAPQKCNRENAGVVGEARYDQLQPPAKFYFPTIPVNKVEAQD